MEYSPKDFLTTEQILSDVLMFVGDEDNKKLPYGWYQSQLQRCLEELSFDTFFHVKHVDVDVPENLCFELPEGTFNVQEVYAYNGSECNIQKASKMWYKRNFYNAGGDTYFAKNRGSANNDPFYSKTTYRNNGIGGVTLFDAEDNSRSGLLFYNVENGVIMFSSSVRRYQRIHIKMSGVSCPLGDVPFIPPFFRSVCIDFVCEAATRALMAKDPAKLRALWQVYDRNLDYNGVNGSWRKAIQRIAIMGKGQRDDMREYLSRWSY